VDFEITPYAQATLLVAEGRIDSASAEDLEAAIEAATGRDASNLALDMKGVEFLSSSGLRVLLNALKTLQEKGGNLCLARPSQRVRESLEIAGLAPFFDIYPDRESAIGSF
jgi:anti-sigma B factor antagonist